MLVNLKTLMEDAEKYKYAVGSFTSPNISAAEAAIEAAEELNAPVIIGQAEEYTVFGAMEKYGPIMVKMAQEAKVPVCVHLDHGLTLPMIMKAVKAGYTSVMADYSTLSFDENARMVKMITEVCHSVGVSVEGLMGRMPNQKMVEEKGMENIKIRDFFTVPEEAARFIEMTQADALTVSFGTVHGMYIQQAHLDFNLLKELKAKANCTLVMHGSSGTEEPELRKAIELGIRKINYVTKYSTKAYAAVVEEGKKRTNPMMFQDVVEISKAAMREQIKKAITLFSNGHSFK